ncbi:MAG: ComEC/Rec2 family competence protein [bacterium]|nr:ComEC/Rec2 family competence protein [bacterium]
MTKSRIFLYLLLAFIAGIALESFFKIPKIFIWSGLFLGLIFGSINIFRGNKTKAVYGFLIFVFFVGVLRLNLAESTVPDLSVFFGKNVLVEGVVWDEPDVIEDKTRLKIHISKIDNQELKNKFFILATFRKYPAFSLGDELALEGKIEEPVKFEDFDYKSYLARQDIFAVSYFPKVDKISERKMGRARLALANIKNLFEEKIELALPEPHAAFLKGLLLGERQSLPEDVVQDLKTTGTTHIIALSGYNITMVGRVFLASLTALAMPFAVSFWAAIIAIILFVIMTGASASLVRAAIMGILVLVARREGRLYHMTNALIFAAALMILQNPRILRFDVAFQLSFLATTGLIYISPKLENFFNKKLFRTREKEATDWTKEKFLSFKRTFIETLSAQIAVLPLLIYIFGQISLISPLTNILVLEAVPYTMTWGFVMAMVGFLSVFLSRILGWLVWILLEYKILVISIFAKIPFASVGLGKWILLPVLAIYVWFWLKIVRTKHV